MLPQIEPLTRFNYAITNFTQEAEDDDDDDDDEFPDDDEIELAVSGILRDLKKTLSASLRSLSIRSGSLTR